MGFFAFLHTATIAPTMKYVDLPSLAGGDPRAPRNRLVACFRRVSIADRAGAAPTNTPSINIFHCRIYKRRIYLGLND